MRSGCLMKRLYCLATMALLAACPSNEVTKKDQRLRVFVAASDEGEPVVLEKGVWDIGNSVDIHTLLLRVDQITLRGANDFNSSTPSNFDLLDESIVFETDRTDFSEVLLDISRPPAGGGVVPDERLSFFVGGLIEEIPFEFRDDAIGSVRFLIPNDTGGDLRIGVDVHRWFADIKLEDLIQTNGVVLFDNAHNSSTHALLESRIANSFFADWVTCSSCGDDL